MVQTNQMISQLNVSVKAQANSKAAKSDDSKGAFAEALDQKLSSQDKTASEPKKDVQENGKAQDKVSAKQPKDDEAQNVQQEPQQTETPVVQETSWLMQALAVQTPMEMQNAEVPVQAEEVLSQADVTAVAATDQADVVQVAAEEKMPEIVVQTDGVFKQADPEAKSDHAVQGAEVKSAAQNEQVASAQTASTKQEGQQKQLNSQGKGQQEVQMETVHSADHAMQAHVQGKQAAAAEQVNLERPQAAQGQTVDMTDPKAGVQNLAKHMSEQINQGKNTFELWLEPANLGKIGVKVAYEGGRAMIQILCMSSKAMEIVAQNAKTLGTIIQQNTGTNTLVVVEQPERQDYLQQEAQQQNRGDEQQDEKKKDKDNNDEEAETESFLQQLRLGLA